MQKRKQTQEEKRKYTPKKKATKSEQGLLRTGGYYGRYNKPLVSTNEKKFKDTTLAATAVPAAGVILSSSVNLIAQGTTESTRIGRKCQLRNIYIHGNISLPSTNTATQTSDIVRLIVYIDKQTNGAAAEVTDILKDADYRSFRNLANQERFVILKDKTYDISAQAQATGTAQTTGVNTYHIKMYKKLDLPIEFSSTTGAITEIKSNNIGIMAIGLSERAEVSYICRIRFDD